MGISVALDDFGTGYSSLTSLEQLPISRVKLDRMLIEGIDSNPRSAAIVRSIVALSHGLGLQVVAEGVERPSQLEMLSHCGPLAVQGYLLAHPVEADQAEAECRAAVARAKAALDAAAMQRRRMPRTARWYLSGRERAGRRVVRSLTQTLPQVIQLRAQRPHFFLQACQALFLAHVRETLSPASKEAPRLAPRCDPARLPAQRSRHALHH